MYIPKRNRLTNVENKLLVTKGGREGEEGQIRSVGLTSKLLLQTIIHKIDTRYKLLYIK